MPESDSHLHTAMFPLQWDVPRWDVVREQPRDSIDTLATAVSHMGARLALQVPDFETHSALIVVEGVAVVEDLRSTIASSVGTGEHWIQWDQWLEVPHVAEVEGILVESDLVIVPSGYSYPDIWGAMTPRPFSCGDCGADLSRESHRPDCRWR